MAKTIETEIKISGQMDASVQKAIASTSKNLEKLDDNVGKAYKNLGQLGKAMTVKVSAGFKKLEKAALVAGAALTTAVAGAAVYGAKKLIDLSNEFQDVTNTIRIGTGATGEQLKKLEASFDNVYKSLPVSKEAVATAIADINTLTGAEGKALEEFTRRALDAADMLQTDAKGLYTAAAQSFNAFGIEADQMSSKLDFVWKVSQSTGAGMQELMETVQKNQTTFRSLGYTYEESIALVGQMEKAGFESTDAMSALQKAVATMGQKGIKDMSKGLENAIKHIKEAKTESEATKLAIEAFGARAGGKMAKGIRDGTLAVDELVAQMNASPETIDKAADATDTIGDKWEELKHHIEVGLRPAVDAITKAMKDFIPVLGNLATQAMPKVQAAAQSLADYITENQGKIIQKIKDIAQGFKDALVWIYENRETLIQVAKNIAKVYLAIKAVQIGVKIWKGLALAVKGVTAAVALCKAAHTALQASMIKQKAVTLAHAAATKASALATKAFAAAQWVMNAAMSANPIGLIIAAVAALVAAIVLLWKNWDKVVAFMKKAWEKFAKKFPKTAAALEKAWNAICDAVKAAWDWVCSALKAAWDWVGNALKTAWEAIKATWQAIVAAIGAAWDWVCSALKAAWDTIAAVFSTAWEGIKTAWSAAFSAIGSAWDTVCGGLKTAWEGVKSFFTTAVGYLSSTFSGLWDGIKSAAVTVFEAIPAIIKTPINAVIKLVNGVIDSINNIGFTIPDWVPGMGGKSFKVNVPKLPMLAAGGFTDGISIAGEAGTEAVISFDPAHRKENQGYLMTAAEMLGMYAAPKETRGATTYNVGGVTFSPVIKTGDNVNRGDLLRQFRACMPDLVDMIENALREREGHRYA